MDKTVNNEFLTVSEAAKLLNVAEATVRNWVHENKIPFERVGHWGIRIHRSTIDELLEGLLVEHTQVRSGRPSLLRGRGRDSFSYQSSGTGGTKGGSVTSAAHRFGKKEPNRDGGTPSDPATSE